MNEEVKNIEIKEDKNIEEFWSSYDNIKKESEANYDNNVKKIAEYINKNGKVLVFTELALFLVIFFSFYTYLTI